MRKLWPAVLAIAAAAAVAGCGASGSTGGSGNGANGGGNDKGKPIRILAIVDTSGPGKQYGSQELIGLQAAAKYYNAHGGIDGHTVQVTASDDGGEPAQATSNAVKELSGSGASKYTMVYPGSEGSETAALIPLMAKFKVFAVPLDDGNNVCVDASKCPNTFALNGPTSLPSRASAGWLVRHKFKKVGIVYEQVAFTQSELPPFQAALRKAGVPYVSASFPASATDITPQMQKLKSSGADAIFAVVVGAPAGYALQARAKLGWNAPLLFDNAGSSLDLTQLVQRQSQLRDSFITVEHCADPKNTSPGFRIARQVSPEIRTTNIPCNLSGNGWDAVVLLNDLVEQSHSTDVDALTKAAESPGPGVQHDPMQIVNPRLLWNASDHDNLAPGPQNYPILPEPAPISGAQNHPVAAK